MPQPAGVTFDVFCFIGLCSFQNFMHMWTSVKLIAVKRFRLYMWPTAMICSPPRLSDKIPKPHPRLLCGKALESGKKMAHKHKLFGPDGLGTNPGFLKMFHTRSPVWPWDKPKSKGSKKRFKFQMFMCLCRSLWKQHSEVISGPMARSLALKGFSFFSMTQPEMTQNSVQRNQ